MDFRTIMAGALCALVLAAPARGQGAWPANCKLVVAATLPFQLANGQLVVDVRVNDTPRQFIVDTGGFSSDISEKVVQDLHLPEVPIHGNVEIRDAGGAKATNYTTVGSLAIGSQVAKNIQLMVSHSGTDGAISPDLLRNFDVEIDFPNRVIKLLRPHPCTDKAVYWTDKFSAVPIDVTESGHIRVPIALNGRNLYALLDTGASLTVLAADVAASRFDIRPQGRQGTLVGAMGTVTSFTDTPFESLKIGDSVLDKPMIAISSGKGDSFPDATSIILGMRELHKFHIYIAYRERRLYIAEEDSRPSAAVTVSAATLAPAEAIAAAKRAAPAPFAGTFTFQVQSTGRGNGQLFLNSEADFHSPANLTVAVPLAEAAKLAADGAGTDDYLKGKHITVIGGARLLRVQQMRDGQPVGDPEIQTRIPVTSATQIAVTP